MNQVDLFLAYDVTTTGYTYGRFSRQMSARKAITAATSTTVTETTAGDNAFDEVGVGDRLAVFNIDTGTWTEVTVTAKASAASITVSAALTVTGSAYRFRKLLSGTTVTDGWVGCGTQDEKVVLLQVDTLNGTSVTANVEGRMGTSAPFTLLNQAFTAASVGATVTGINDQIAFPIPENVTSVRVGWKVTGDSGVQSVSAWYRGVQRGRS